MINFDRFLSIFANFWPNKRDFDQFWPNKWWNWTYGDQFGSISIDFEYFWPICDQIYAILTNLNVKLDQFWPILTNFWPIQIIFDNFKPILTNFDLFDPMLTDLTNFNQFETVKMDWLILANFYQV